MSILFLMVGISGSGKSTLAEKIKNQLFINQNINSVIISTNGSHAELCNDKNDKLEFETAYSLIDSFLKRNTNVIFDSLNLAIEDRRIPISIGRKYNSKIVACVLNTPLTLSIEQNKKRDRVVPTSVIWKQQGRFHPPNRDEVDEVIQIGLPKLTL